MKKVSVALPGATSRVMSGRPRACGGEESARRAEPFGDCASVWHAWGMTECGHFYGVCGGRTSVRKGMAGVGQLACSRFASVTRQPAIGPLTIKKLKGSAPSPAAVNQRFPSEPVAISRGRWVDRPSDRNHKLGDRAHRGDAPTRCFAAILTWASAGVRGPRARPLASNARASPSGGSVCARVGTWTPRCSAVLSLTYDYLVNEICCVPVRLVTIPLSRQGCVDERKH